jgi:methylated-DNA-[protein]-cysteine S-methyltransferase
MERNSSARYVTAFESPVGTLTVASDGAALTAVAFPLWRGKPRQTAAGERRDDLPVFGEARRWLETYFSGRDPGPIPPVRTGGSPFQELVWAELQRIPYGQVTTYGAIAGALEARTGRRQAAQAVGGAVGRNPVAILIPCHRVVGADGGLTGFGGGIDVKCALLKTEGVRL